MTQRNLTPIKIPPGLYQNGTRYSAKDRWHRANLVRFKRGIPQPVGGWSALNSPASILGRANNIFAWKDNTGIGWVAIGTEQGLYVMDEDYVIYDITPVGFVNGNADAGTYSGYGVGPYGVGPYSASQALTGGIPTPPSTWVFDVWGDYLLAQFAQSGQIYEWALNTATPAAVVSNSPTGNRGFLVTDERIVLAYGASGDARRLQSSDSENNTVWTPAQANQSIDRNIKSKSGLITGKMFKGSPLLWTEDSLWRGQYVRPPLVYEFNEVGGGFGILGQNAVAVTDKLVIWMGLENFWVYDGGAISELPCSVAGELFRDINTNQQAKAYAVVNSAFGEVWWFYPSGASTECDSYVIYNYTENLWSRGMIDRTAGVDRGVFPRPFWVDDTGQVYEQEVIGQSLGGNTPYIESGPIEMQNGDRIVTVNGIFPDSVASNDDEIPDVLADFDIYLKAQLEPGGAVRTAGPYSSNAPEGARITGRQIAVRLEGTTGLWNIGTYRYDVKIRGRK